MAQVVLSGVNVISYGCECQIGDRGGIGDGMLGGNWNRERESNDDLFVKLI